MIVTFVDGRVPFILFFKDYVVDKWDEVAGSAEFEQCCQEVAAGE